MSKTHKALKILMMLPRLVDIQTKPVRLTVCSLESIMILISLALRYLKRYRLRRADRESFFASQHNMILLQKHAADDECV